MPDPTAEIDSEVALRSLTSIERAMHARGAEDHALISICTVLEVYVDSSLQHLIEASGVGQLKFGRAMIMHLEDQFSQSWTARLRWLSNGFGISIAGSEVDGDRATVIEARNALVHGGGKLTARQSRSATEALDLQRRLRDRMSAELVGHSVVIREPAVKWSLEVARAYIRMLDPLIQQERAALAS
jgi:hypothetical protein